MGTHTNSLVSLESYLILLHTLQNNFNKCSIFSKYNHLVLPGMVIQITSNHLKSYLLYTFETKTPISVLILFKVTNMQLHTFAYTIT
jgi:hypothetical protein